MQLPPYLQKLIDECKYTTLDGIYALGIHDAYKAMCEPAKKDVEYPVKFNSQATVMYVDEHHAALSAKCEALTLMNICERHELNEKIRALELKIEELENYNIELQRETDHE